VPDGARDGLFRICLQCRQPVLQKRMIMRVRGTVAQILPVVQVLIQKQPMGCHRRLRRGLFECRLLISHHCRKGKDKAEDLYLLRAGAWLTVEQRVSCFGQGQLEL